MLDNYLVSIGFDCEYAGLNLSPAFEVQTPPPPDFRSLAAQCGRWGGNDSVSRTRNTSTSDYRMLASKM